MKRKMMRGRVELRFQGEEIKRDAGEFATKYLPESNFKNCLAGE